MKLRVLYLAFTVLMSATVLGLLIYVGYSWYIDNKETKATEIRKIMITLKLKDGTFTPEYKAEKTVLFKLCGLI